MDDLALQRIPDDYPYMDPDLVDELQRSVGAILGLE
jgi:predicted protein tyrosine phosphatase